MKILIVGDADSWIKPVIDNTMLPYGHDVTVLSLNGSVKYKDFYKKNHIKIVPIILPKMRYVGTLLSGILNIRKFIGYDIICFHFISNLAFCMLPFAKLCCKKVTASFWGSDILRRSKRFTSITRALLKRADIITLSTPDMIDRFHSFYGHVLDSKIRITHYGLNTLEIMKKTTFNTDTLYEKYNIPKNKIVVAIGHNKAKEQQHLKVLEVINTLSDATRQKLHLMFRLTYGNGDSEYINKIKEMVNQSGCTGSFFEKFMSDEEIAETTYLPDMFIHAQTTDARSGSMCEHMFAECLIINPSWLPYNELKGKVFYLKYDTFDELRSVLIKNLAKKNDCKYRDKLIANKDAIYTLTSWASCVDEWRDVYLR